MDAKWLFHARRARAAQRRRSFFIGNVAGDKDEATGQTWAVDGNPGINLSAIDSARSAHVGDDAVKIAGLQQAQRFRARFSRYDAVAVALKHGAHQRHDGRFVFNQQHSRSSGFGSSLCHWGCTPATAPKDAVSVATGRRTIKVAPSESGL